MATTSFPFLSPAWITAARAVRDRHVGDLPAMPPVRANLVVNDVPFTTPPGGALHAHLDTAAGGVGLDEGHLEDADATITMGYDTARALFVEQDAQAFMQSFFAGKIVIQGDITKLLALQAMVPTTEDAIASARVVAAEMTAITS